MSLERLYFYRLALGELCGQIVILDKDSKMCLCSFMR